MNNERTTAERVTQGPLVAWTETTLSSPDALAVELAEVRRRKRALDHAELTPGLYCVAAPVFDDDEAGISGTRAVAALSASAPDESALSRLEPLVTRVAISASRALAEDR